MRQKLTDEQMDALQQFAYRNGRTWKSQLNRAWMTGCYSEYEGGSQYASALQQVRNEFGPTWLTNFKLPKFVEAAR